MTEHLDDLEADFLAIYRVDNMLQLPAAKFFRLAERCAAYKGVIQARIVAEHQAAEESRTSTSTSTNPPPPTRKAPPTTSAAQRLNLQKRGGETATVPATSTTYLAEKLKGARA